MALETNATPTLSLGRFQSVAAVVAAEGDRLADLGVSERLVLVLVPSEARKQPQAVGDFLLGVQAKAVFHCAEAFGLRDVGRSDLSGEILLHRLAVVAHVRVVHVAQARAPRPRALDSAAARTALCAIRTPSSARWRG